MADKFQKITASDGSVITTRYVDNGDGTFSEKIAGGGSGGGGGVSSVGLTAPAIFSITGSPVTASGSLAISLANQTANKIWAGPTSGGAAGPTFRSLVAADIPTALNGTSFAGASSITVGTDAGIGLTFAENSVSVTGHDIKITNPAHSGTTWFTIGPYFIPSAPTASQNGMFSIVQMPAVFQDSNGVPEVQGFGWHLRVGFAASHTANDAGVAGLRVHMLNASDNNTSYGFNATYAGPLDSAGINIQNQSAGTGTTPYTGATAASGNAIGQTGDFGIISQSNGGGSGWNLGVAGYAKNGTTFNIGVSGAAIVGTGSGATMIGVIGLANGGSAASVGVWAGLSNTEPTIAGTAALIVDNQHATSSTLAMFCVNGTNTLQVDQNGVLGSPTATGNGVAALGVSIIGGSGSASTANGTNGGAATTLAITSGTGGAASTLGNSNQNGGVGAPLTITSGAGGAATTTGTGTYVGGPAGAITIQGGNGGGATGGTATSNTGGAGATINITGGNGGAASNGGANIGGVAGAVNVTGGVGGFNQPGGAVAITGGAGAASGTSAVGGAASLVGGVAGSASATGGAVNVTGGDAKQSSGTGVGGAVTVASGRGGSTSGNSGTVTIKTGTVVTGTVGSILIAPGGTTTVTISATSTTFATNLAVSGVDIVTGTASGTRFGTATNQKIAFYGATAIIQPSAVGTATGYAAGSTAVTFHSDDTYTGNTGSTAYTINGLVAGLKALGLIAT